MTLDDEIAAARERIVERELSDPFDIFDATVLFMRPKLDAANAEIARLEATWKAERDLTNRTASRLFRERGAKQRAEAKLADAAKLANAQRKLDAIRAEHYQDSDGLGCAVCGAQDGYRWPCTTRLILDEQPAAEGARE